MTISTSGQNIQQMCLAVSRTVVVLNSYPLIKEAFSKKEFSGRPNMFSGTFFQKGKTGQLFFNAGLVCVGT